MGSLRDFNPLMLGSWHAVPFPKKDEDMQVNGVWLDWKAYGFRKDSAIEWCRGPMVHGRFSVGSSGHYIFYFKGKKDALMFKLTFGGS